MTPIRFLCAGILIAALAAACTNRCAAEPKANCTAAQLTKGFADNVKSIKDKYLNQKAIVEGTVDTIVDKDKGIVALKGHNSDWQVLFVLSSDFKPLAAKLKVGKKIKVYGLVTGTQMNRYVVLVDCSLEASKIK